MTKTADNEGIDLLKALNSIILVLCAASLVFIAWSLWPVAIWANNQNICVNQEVVKSKAPISWGVRKCNGRSKVYQVK